jgi:glyoxylase-like metal-dependent hydrolase (beta-lactamase superfamily II)
MKCDLARNAVAGAVMAAAVLVPALLPGAGSPRDDAWHAWAEDTVFTVREVRPGVHFAVGRQGQLVGANSVFIVTDRDVILVDDHITPRAARALVEEIRRITPQPLRYVINTHFHYDHASGNEIFGPEVEIVSHPATRARLLESGQQSIRGVLDGIPATLAALRARRDTARSDSARAALDRTIGNWEQLAEDYRALTVTLPTLTVDSSLVLHRGGNQEIRIFYMGRGHTAGDVVVQLPREGLLLTGDLITNTAGPPFMSDGYAGEWGATLRRLAQLDFTTTLPGHGQPFDGKARYSSTADFLDDLWRQVQAATGRGVAREAVAAQVNVSGHAATFPALRTGLNPAFVQRAWDVAMGRGN